MSGRGDVKGMRIQHLRYQHLLSPSYCCHIGTIADPSSIPTDIAEGLKIQTGGANSSAV